MLGIALNQVDRPQANYGGDNNGTYYSSGYSQQRFVPTPELAAH
jgi:hypothetical protein